MRFAEKSFEVRFCAALSAAAMPFNRNPQWFGMTQAQERRSGIDTMIRIGGHLLIFQFKAKNDAGRFLLKREQWHRLAKIGRTFPRSTFYVFPDEADIMKAATWNCILNHSWCCRPSGLKKVFKRKAASATLALGPAGAFLERQNPRVSVRVQSACQEFGCFCPSSKRPVGFSSSDARNAYFTSLNLSDSDSRADRPLKPFADRFLGIPVGDVTPGAGDDRIVTSPDTFETMLGDGAHSNLDPGLFGLFIPRD